MPWQFNAPPPNYLFRDSRTARDHSFPRSEAPAHKYAPPLPGNHDVTSLIMLTAWVLFTLLPAPLQSRLQNPKTTLLASPPKTPFTRFVKCVFTGARLWLVCADRCSTGAARS